MSEGFHKRPRMNFPSALAVGIAGANEVVELELEQDRDSHEIISTLNAFAPPGLTVESVERLPDGTRFSQPASAVYEVPLPADRCEAVRLRAALLQFLDRRADRRLPAPRDLRVARQLLRLRDMIVILHEQRIALPRR